MWKQIRSTLADDKKIKFVGKVEVDELPIFLFFSCQYNTPCAFRFLMSSQYFGDSS